MQQHEGEQGCCRARQHVGGAAAVLHRGWQEGGSRVPPALTGTFVSMLHTQKSACACPCDMPACMHMPACLHMPACMHMPARTHTPAVPCADPATCQAGRWLQKQACRSISAHTRTHTYTPTQMHACTHPSRVRCCLPGLALAAELGVLQAMFPALAKDPDVSVDQKAAAGCATTCLPLAPPQHACHLLRCSAAAVARHSWPNH